MKLIVVFFALVIFMSSVEAQVVNLNNIKKSKTRSKKRSYKKKRRYKRVVRKEKGSVDESVPGIDDTQKFISSHWVGLNHSLDMYFSEEEYKKSKNKSKIIASYEIYKKEGQSLEKNFDIKARVHFPKVSKRLSLTIEKERNEIVESRSSVANKSRASRESDYSAGISYILHESPYWKTDLNTGLRIYLPLNPYGKLNFHKEIKTRYVDINASQKFILFRQEGASEVTQLSFSKRLNVHFSISQNNTLTWTDEEDIFVHRNSLGLGHIVDNRNSFSYAVGANAYLSPSFYYYMYDASVGYRRRIHKRWLYGNISFGAEFPKSNDFKEELFVMSRIEVKFQ